MNEKESFEKWLSAKAGVTFSDCVQKYSGSNNQFNDLPSYNKLLSCNERKLIYRNNDYLINLAGGQSYVLNYNRYTFSGEYCEKIFAKTSFYFQYKNVTEMVLTFQEIENELLRDNKLQFILSFVESYYSGISGNFFDCTFIAKMNGKKIGLQRFRVGYGFSKEYECKANLNNINFLALVDYFLKDGELKRLYDKFLKRSVELPKSLFNLSIDNEIKEIREKQLAEKTSKKREKRLKILKFYLLLPWTICKLPWLIVRGIYNAYRRWECKIKENKARRAKWFE